MNEKNIEMLKARLLLLGFELGVEERLRAEICFSPQSFDLGFPVEAGKDHFEVSVHFSKGEREMFDTIYYTAAYRKPVPIPAELQHLDERMGGIDWEALQVAKGFATQNTTVVLAEMAKKAYLVLKDVKDHSQGSLLLFKHWVGTALEVLVPNLGQLRAQIEITQRFYFMEDQQPISAAEALRFLQSRWVEKKVVAERRLLVKHEKPAVGGFKSGGAKGTGGKLLAKRPRSSRKGLLDN